MYLRYQLVWESRLKKQHKKKCFKLEFSGGQSLLSEGCLENLTYGELSQAKSVGLLATMSFFHSCLKFSTGEVLAVV